MSLIYRYSASGVLHITSFVTHPWLIWPTNTEHTHARTHAHTHTHVHTYMYIHTHVHACIASRTHTHYLRTYFSRCCICLDLSMMVPPVNDHNNNYSWKQIQVYVYSNTVVQVFTQLCRYLNTKRVFGCTVNEWVFHSIFCN